MRFSGFGGLSGEEDRDAAASYCGQKFGVTSSDFQPCVNWYVDNKPGDYKPGGAGTTAQTTQTSPTTQATNIVSSIFSSGTPPTNPLLPIPTPWYKTPMGIGLLVVGGLVGYKLLNK